MSEVKLFNMCMVYNKKTNQAVVLDRVKKDWPGITFPGGKVENGESIVQSTIREVKEETGLQVAELTLKGVVHWYNPKTTYRWMIFLYKTNHFCDSHLVSSSEGRVFWEDIDNLADMPLANGFGDYLKIFNGDRYTEAYGIWDDQLINQFIMY